MRHVTIQNIADQLGLSKYAVSRALSGKPGVSEATRALVVKTAARLGYVREAPTIRRSRKRIVLVFHDRDVSNNELWVNVLDGVQAAAAEAGYVVGVRMIAEPDDLPSPERDLVGYVLAGPHDPALFTAVRQHGLPVVCAGSVAPLEPIDQVGIAEEEGGYAIGRHLAALGHREVVAVLGKPGFKGREMRRRGIGLGLQSVAPESRLHPLTFDEAGDFRPALFTLLAGGVTPTAFACGTDGLAVTVVSELSRHGVAVPDEASVTGFLDFRCATQVVPALTTVRAPMREMGEAAITCLLERSSVGQKQTSAYRRIALVPRFVERKSSSAAGDGGWATRFRRCHAA